MSLRNRIIWLVVFSIAMGFLEAAVVVYLRELYYPNGFAFPLVVLDPHVGLVEIGREAATLVMLVSLGMLVGQTFRQRFAFFLISFAVWDLFYYVFLKLTLDWPSSLLTWDILFLIPAPWVGPVISPLIVCVTMLVLSGVILRNEQRGVLEEMGWRSWVPILSGSLIIVIAWLQNYLNLSGSHGLSPSEMLQAMALHIPNQFSWGLFVTGELIILAGVAHYGRRRPLNS